VYYELNKGDKTLFGLTHVLSQTIMFDAGSQVDIALFYRGQKPKRLGTPALNRKPAFDLCLISTVGGYTSVTDSDMKINVIFLSYPWSHKDLTLIT